MQFLHDALTYYGRLGVTIKRVLTDNGAASRSKSFRAACAQLGIEQKFTRAYRPQINGKAERFIQSALREWTYGWTYQNSAQRSLALQSWQNHYNWHRPHHGIGRVPRMSRLAASRNNLLTFHTLIPNGTKTVHLATSRSQPDYRGTPCLEAGRIGAQILTLPDFGTLQARLAYLDELPPPSPRIGEPTFRFFA